MLPQGKSLRVKIENSSSKLLLNSDYFASFYHHKVWSDSSITLCCSRQNILTRPVPFFFPAAESAYLQTTTFSSSQLWDVYIVHTRWFCKKIDSFVLAGCDIFCHPFSDWAMLWAQQCYRKSFNFWLNLPKDWWFPCLSIDSRSTWICQGIDDERKNIWWQSVMDSQWWVFWTEVTKHRSRNIMDPFSSSVQQRHCNTNCPLLESDLLQVSYSHFDRCWWLEHRPDFHSLYTIMCAMYNVIQVRHL